MYGTRGKTVTDKVSSLTKAVSYVPVQHANLCDDLDEMKTIVQRMKADVVKFLFTASSEMQKMYDNLIDAVRRKFQEDIVDGWKKTGTHSQVESARLAVSVKGELFRISLDV